MVGCTYQSNDFLAPYMSVYVFFFTIISCGVCISKIFMKGQHLAGASVIDKTGAEKKQEGA